MGWSPANQPPKRSGMAIAALVLGIVAIPLLLFFIPAVLAFIFGLIAASTIKKQPVRDRLGLARAGWILGVVSFVGGVAAWVVLVAVFGDTKNALDLETGECIEIDLQDDDDSVGRVPLKDCDEPHDAEVVGILQLNPGRDREYPGNTMELNLEANPQCEDRFREYTGRELDDPSWEVPLRVTSIVTDEDSWDEERGRAICLAFDSSGAELSATVRR